MEKKSAKLGLRKTDVLLGRGKSTAFWHGNVAFRRIIWKHKSAFAEGDRHEKWSVMESVLKHIKEQKPPGRFMEQTSNGTYKEANKAKQMEKIRQALRDKKCGPAYKKKVVAADIGSPDKKKKEVTADNRPPSTEKSSTKATNEFTNPFSNLQKNAVAQVLVNMMMYEKKDGMHPFGDQWMHRLHPGLLDAATAGSPLATMLVAQQDVARSQVPHSVTPPASPPKLQQAEFQATEPPVQQGSNGDDTSLGVGQQGDPNGWDLTTAKDEEVPKQRELPLHVKKFMAFLRGPLVWPTNTAMADHSMDLLDDIDEDIWNVLAQ